jgi:dienelactone hydrolase
MSRLNRRALLVGAAASLGACASNPWARAAAVVTRNSVPVVDPVDGRRLQLRIACPSGGTGLPVILFSHGLYSSKDDYDPIVDDWAARGYVVIVPTHRDSVTLGVQRGTFEPRFLAWRMADMRLILRQLPEVLGVIPGLAARADTTRLAATGHSLGGLVAQSLGGTRFRDPVGGEVMTEADSRVRATIIISGPGVMPNIVTAADFAGLQGPVLVSAGSNDLKQDPVLTGYEWRRQPYDLSPPGDKFLLTLTGADHYLGGSVGRDDLVRDANAYAYLDAFGTVSGHFLAGWLRDESPAREWLRQCARADSGDGSPSLARLEAK